MALHGLELETLLAPFEGSPAGVDISAEPGFLELRDEVMNVRQLERQLERDAIDGFCWNGGPDWGSIVAMTSRLLAEAAKDLRVAAWMTEALMHTDGIAGLAFGLELINRLIEDFREILHPLPDTELLEGDELEERLLAIARLTGIGYDGHGSILRAPLMNLRLFSEPDGAPVSLYAYERSEAAISITDTLVQELSYRFGVIPYNKVKQGGHEAASELAALRPALTQARAGCARLGIHLDRLADNGGHLGRLYSPSTEYIGDLLARINAVVERYAPASTGSR